MVQIIAVALFARQEYREFVRWPVGAQVMRLGSILGLALCQQVFQVAGFADIEIVKLVFFVVDLFEFRGAQQMPPELVTALGDGVFGH
jgi:hypothetical protein